MTTKKQVSSGDQTICQLKITLLDLSPEVWRRVWVPENMTLGQLHFIIQRIMPWESYHMHHFVIDGEFYGSPLPDDDFFDMKVIPEDKYRLDQVFSQGKHKIQYEYDFGDGWMHEIVLEKRLPLDPTQHYPVCVEGTNACPPEDCGGIGGYAEFLEVLRNPTHPEHEGMKEWIGGSFDPEHFAMDSVNNSLHSLFRSKKSTNRWKKPRSSPARSP